MKRFATTLLLAVMLLAMPLKQWGQQPYRQYADDGILLDFHKIDNVDFRVFLLYNLTQDNRFVLIADDEPGQFSISSSEEGSLASFSETFDEFYNNTLTNFGLLSKTDISILFPAWKDCIPPVHFVSIMMDIVMRNGNRPVNNHCVDSDPFCTSDVITFAAATTSQTADQLEGTTLQDGCIGSSYNPSWFHMRIQTGGQFIIHAEGHDPNNSSTTRDIDFCIWGPYADPTSPCVAQLTTDKIIDCCFSASYSEDIYLGYQPSSHSHGGSGHGTVYYHLPEVGEYYILMITNYSQQPCTISFTKTANSGPGETDCGILPGVVTNDGPYCVGQTIHLSVNAQEGATYSWTGPAGFSSSQQNPSRPNCTMNMAGTYTCTTTVGSQSVTATTEVVIYPQPTANFNFTTVCVGNPTQFTSTSTTNPSGQQITSYGWRFGDGGTSTQQNPSHQYASPGNYQVTLNVSCGNGLCSSSTTRTVTVYEAPVANAGPDQTIGYGSTAQLSGSGGSGTFNFHWEPANMVSNSNSQNTQTVPLTQDQTYTLTVTNAQGGCSSTDEVTIHISGSAMTVSAYADPSSICQGGSTQLVANAGGGTGNFTYSWTPTTGLSNPNIYNPMASPSQTTTYTCHVSDGQTSQNVTVTVTVNDIIVEDEYMTICPDDVYQWHGTPYTGTGTYQFDTVTSQGCLKTIYLHLDNYPTYDETTITEAICYGDTYTFYGNTYNSSIQTSYTDHTIHGCDSIVRLNLTVYPDNGVTLNPVTVCPEQLPYTFYGVDYYDETDVTVFDTDIHDCDSAVRLILTISDHYEPPTVHKYVGYYDTPSYDWYIPEANTTLTYTEDGLYTEILSTSTCEGIFTLDLHFGQIPETVQIDTTVCDRFNWYVKGYLVDSYTNSCNPTYDIPLCYEPNNLSTQFMYYDPSNPNNPIPCVESYELHLTVNHESVNNPVNIDGIQNHVCDIYPYYHPNIGDTLYFDHNINTELVGHTPEGCNFKVQLNITNMQYTPHPIIDCSDYNVTNPHWPITATEFNVNRYTYQVKDRVSDISRWDLSQCKWEISKPSWRIVPNPSGNNPLECMVYAMDWVPDSICLSFKAVNSCSGNEGVIAEYWLHPSFYGVEEQEAYPAAVSVIPNPNNGQMQLRFENLEGNLSIKVYSLTGTLVDTFELKSVKTGETHEYSMKRLMNGIYFLNISDGKRSVTKKVVVIH